MLPGLYFPYLTDAKISPVIQGVGTLYEAWTIEVKGQNHRTCLYKVVDNAQSGGNLQSKQGHASHFLQWGQSLSPKSRFDIL
jgi:hypothetical protein